MKLFKPKDVNTGKLENTIILYLPEKILEFIYIFTRPLEKYWGSRYIIALHFFSFKNLYILSFSVVLRYSTDIGSV